jgi:hypothetical protein
MIRRIGAFGALLPLAMLLTGAPAVSAANCPDLLTKTTYYLGEPIGFFGSYDDFADPGTVTIVLTRPADGLTRTYTAFNNPDGAWLRDITFTSRSFLGSWRARVTVDQTSGTDVCDDRFVLAARGTQLTPPPTDTVEATRSTGTAPAGWLVLAGVIMVGFAAVLSLGARRRT